MKTKLLIAVLALSTSVSAQNTWTQKAPVGGPVRIAASSFAIGTKGYIGTGYNNQMDSTLTDFWEWNSATNIWTQKANFSGPSRGWAMSKSMGTKGYVGMGYDSITMGDFWEYDAALDSWTQKALFGGSPVSQTASMVIGTNLYVLGRAYDFWEYNPGTDVWTQKTDYPGLGYTGLASFSIGNKGYLGTGQSFQGGYCKDFWEYNPQLDTWTQKTDFGGIGRACAVGFTIGSRGYIGTGGGSSNGSILYKDFWEYNPINDTWKQRASFGGTARFVATGFAMNGKGYIGTGWDASGNRNDFWEYTPDTGSTGVQEYAIEHSIAAYPNPFSSETTLHTELALTDATLIVYNAFGQQINVLTHVKGQTITFNRGDLPAGLYFIHLIDGNKRFKTSKMTVADF